MIPERSMMKNEQKIFYRIFLGVISNPREVCAASLFKVNSNIF